MDSELSGSIIEAYDRNADKYLAFGAKVAGLVRELFEAADIRAHSIDARLKNRDSLFKKVIRPEAEYAQLTDITDVAGLRVITYFAEDVDRIARIIADEFEVDWTHSVDKREAIESDRFGYVSLHFVVSVGAARLQLMEYRRFAGMKLEIQIRSILQHAWAEIEHDLGYKAHLEVPREVRRRFSRLSGLLELVDTEFNQIRRTLSHYEVQVAGQIELSPDKVLIDRASVENFVIKGQLVAAVDSDIARSLGREINYNNFYPEQLVQQLTHAGLKTIADISEALSDHRGLVKAFVLEWLDQADDSIDTYDWLPPGMSLFYLCIVLSAKNGSVHEVYNYLKASIAGHDDERPLMAQRIVGICSRLMLLNRKGTGMLTAQPDGPGADRV
ncbi:MAG: hypothetical protein H7338_13670 [Candidatus Sericytochromatia bacterium]|nr:hypothetical protein [Candidatus Sericytochromatia bacterium]